MFIHELISDNLHPAEIIPNLSDYEPMHELACVCDIHVCHPTFIQESLWKAVGLRMGNGLQVGGWHRNLLPDFR